MKKLGIVGIIVLLLAIILTSAKVTTLERSPLCDQYRVSINAPIYIPDDCVKK